MAKFRTCLLSAALLLGGCDHHQTHTAASSEGTKGAQAQTITSNQPAQPIDSMKSPVPPPPATTEATSRRAETSPTVAGDSAPSSVPASSPSEASSNPGATTSTGGPEALATTSPDTPTPAPASAESSSLETPGMASARGVTNPPMDSSPAPASESAPGATPPTVDLTTPPPSPSTGGMNIEAPGLPANPAPGAVVNGASAADANQVIVLQTSFGKMVMALDDFAAPKTCKNFRELVEDGFYNNTVFHRVIPNFVIQGGDPKSKSSAVDRRTFGSGGPGYTLPAEIAQKHDRGAVAMARLPDEVNPQRESNGSQFYICLAACPSLDDQDTVFAHIVQGLDVADKIAAQTRDERDNPLQRIEMVLSLEPRDEALAQGSADHR